MHPDKKNISNLMVSMAIKLLIGIPSPAVHFWEITLTFKPMTLKCHHCQADLVLSNCDKFH